jgi:hypothetical protein
VCSFLLLFIFNLSVNAESIHFDEYIYKFKESKIATDAITNEYYKQKENPNYWTSRFVIVNLKNEKSPIKFSIKKDTEIEQNKNCILLKFIQNKKKNIALISYIENINQNKNKFFIYKITKIEKSSTNGISTISFEKKYVLNTQNDAEKMAKQIKSKNDDFMERMIITDIPEIITE